MLIDNGIDVNSPDSDGITPLMLAALNVSPNPTPNPSPNPSPYPCIIVAETNIVIYNVFMLIYLSIYMHLHLSTSIYIYISLYLSIYLSIQGNKEIVEQLLLAGADSLLSARDGSTAFSIATSSGRKVVALIIAEADLRRAIVTGREDIILESVRAGAFVDLPTASGWTALIYACATGNTNLARSLLDMGANVNRAEADGWTPLHFAAHNGYADLVKMLLDAGANSGWINGRGATARDLATAAKHDAVAKLIPMTSQPL